jgi:hypothetical protein
MKENLHRISLINYEGDCLWAKKDGSEIVIYDQWDSIVEILTTEKFLDWVDGKFELSDSEGKSWAFQKEALEAKPKFKEIFFFLTKKTDGAKHS